MLQPGFLLTGDPFFWDLKSARWFSLIDHENPESFCGTERKQCNFFPFTQSTSEVIGFHLNKKWMPRKSNMGICMNVKKEKDVDVHSLIRKPIYQLCNYAHHFTKWKSYEILLFFSNNPWKTRLMVWFIWWAPSLVTQMTRLMGAYPYASLR